MALYRFPNSCCHSLGLDSAEAGAADSARSGGYMFSILLILLLLRVSDFGLDGDSDLIDSGLLQLRLGEPERLEQ